MSEKFSFKEIDKDGEETLYTVAQAERFNKWMYETIHPYCKGRVLEIGSGIGNISKFFINDGFQIVLSDIRIQYCAHLSNIYPENQVEKIDLTNEKFESSYSEHLERYDTVFALNVIEHIEDDSLAILNIKKLLKPQGHCIILVPAFSFLYNSFDQDLYHYRRYNRAQLNILLSAHFDLLKSKYFNPVGILGWYWNGNILKKKKIPSDQMKTFDRIVPLFKVFNYFTKNFFGLSVFTVGRKM